MSGISTATEKTDGETDKAEIRSLKVKVLSADATTTVGALCRAVTVY